MAFPIRAPPDSSSVREELTPSNSSSRTLLVVRAQDSVAKMLQTQTPTTQPSATRAGVLGAGAPGARTPKPTDVRRNFAGRSLARATLHAPPTFACFSSKTEPGHWGLKKKPNIDLVPTAAGVQGRGLIVLAMHVGVRRVSHHRYSRTSIHS